MSNNEIIKNAQELAELKQMKTEIEDAITALEDAFKAMLTERNETEMTAGNYTITWSEYTAMRFDASAFKKAMPELANQYTKTSTARRFTIK